jgi:hypothetical protein
MTTNQRLVVSSFERNAKTASTESLRDHALEQLKAYLDRLAERRRYDRPSPFSRFVARLENAGREALPPSGPPLENG